MKLLSTILSFVLIAQLLVATSGMPLVYHFCGEELDSVSLGKTPSQCACNHESDDDSSTCEKDCCHDEITISKLSFDALTASAQYAPELVLAAPITLWAFFQSVPSQPCIDKPSTLIHSPPHRSSDIPIFIRSLLI